MLSAVINKAVMVAIDEEQGAMTGQLEALAQGMEEINVALKESKQLKEFEHKIATTLQSMHGNYSKKMSEWDAKLSTLQVQVRQMEEQLWRT